MLEEAVAAQLAATSGVTALVGSGANARITSAPLPQDSALPAITYQRIGGNREHCFGTDPGNVESRLQVWAWATTAKGAAALADAIRVGLNRKTVTVGGDTIDASFAGAPIHTYESGRKIHGYFTDYMIWTRET